MHDTLNIFYNTYILMERFNCEFVTHLFRENLNEMYAIGIFERYLEIYMKNSPVSLQ